MTGTAMTEAAEFGKTYKIDVLEIPTNKTMIRKDSVDIVYRTEEEKFRNAAKEIKRAYETGQPVLVGTISVEKSERLSAILKKMGVKHEVLNAKNHEREAFIVAQAGRKAAVTVSTNMAGRGTDILLGGNPEFMAKEILRKQGKDPDAYQIAAVGTPERAEWDSLLEKYRAETDAEREEVRAAGGLYIVGTERHESRRIDNQLRGRAGRQGDPGASRFYLSLQDDLLRIFGGERIQNLMLRLGMTEDEPIESKMITKRIQAAQKAVEAQNFAARKHLLEYDDVMNKQRTAVYSMRRALLEGADQKEKIREMIDGILATQLDRFCADGIKPYEWDLNALQSEILTQFGVRIEPSQLSELTREEMEESIRERLYARYDEKERMISPELMRETERIIMLNVIDNQWKDHLLSMDHLKEGIGMRAYGQKDPLIEYKKESFKIFQDMMDRIEDETVRYLFFLQIAQDDGPSVIGVRPDAPDRPELPEPEPELEPATVAAAQSSVLDFTRSIQKKKEREMAALSFVGGDTSGNKTQAPVVNTVRVGRNDPCPCGSGKKYKKCCGVNS
jgi:preprotein translocase subunit SecA